MRCSSMFGILSLAGVSTAFSDTTPWILLSTSPFKTVPITDHIQSNAQVLKTTTDFLANCPSDNYLVITQPGLHASDLQHVSSRTSAIPNLENAVHDARVNARYIIPEVVGEVLNLSIRSMIESSCNEVGREVQVNEHHLMTLPSEFRLDSLQANDDLLGPSFQKIMKDNSFTIILLSPPAEPMYESDFAEPVRMDLRRHLQGSRASRTDNNTDWAKLPLFEKYQFFTPGIFMAIVTAIVLLSILFVGISALSSLEVPYGAFDKAMGPSAQKKQQ